ncbi:MAG: hypothetical protein LUE23_00605, partial [Lachnospiraceae bacterium]|nr:hypothetical protein [Lachnospiraceae bacterium]
SMGKRIRYKLTELALESGRVNDAETFYKKYLEEAPDENDRYILRYLIAEAKGEDLDKRIVILETYRKYEFEEQWACRLAELYQKANRKDECVALCDQIILWFGVGPYVDRAMELKEMYVPLTASQREHRENKAFYEARLAEMARSGEEEEKPEAQPVQEPQPSGLDEKPVEDDLPEIALSEEVAAADPEEPAGMERHFIPETEAEEKKADRIQAMLFAASKKMEEAPVEESAWREAAVTRQPLPEAEPVKLFPEEETPEPVLFSEEVSPAVAEPEPEPENLEVTREFTPIPEMAAEAMSPAEDLEVTREFTPARVLEAAAGAPEKAPEPEVMKEALQEEAATEVTEPEQAETEEAVIPEEAALSEELVKELLSEAGRQEVQEPAESRTVREEEPAAAADVPEGPVLRAAVDEPFVTETPVEPDVSLEADSHVLPVLSFEETEQAVWEEQNRRMEEKEPLESHELEHCIFISAATSEDGIDKAVEALEDYYHGKGQDLPRIAKIVADKLNHRGIVHSLPQLNRKDLIVDQANNLSDDMIREMLEVIDYLDTEKVFVLVDAPTAVSRLKQRVRSCIIESEKEHAISEAAAEDDLPKIQLTDLEEEPAAPEEPKEEKPPVAARKVVKVEKPVSFENMTTRQELSEKDFVRYADYYANELECVIDDSGFEALQEEIEAIKEEGARLTVGEARAVIEEAAEHAAKFTVKRIFASKYDKEGYLILRNRDFL